MAVNTFRISHTLSLAFIGFGLIVIAVGLACLAVSMRMRFYRPRHSWRLRAYSLFGLGTGLTAFGAVV